VSLHLNRSQSFVLGAVIVLVVLLQPSSVLATFAAQITLAWDPSPGSVAGYVIDYGPSPGSYTSSVDVGAQTAGTISGLGNGVRYYFVVRAYSSSGVFSSPSNEVSSVIGSVQLSFTDDPLVPGVHTMKAVHMTELRSRIDALRAARGLAAWPWASLSAGTLIRGSDITELRTALNSEYAERRLPAPAYADSSTSGAPIKAAHIIQLRTFVTALVVSITVPSPANQPPTAALTAPANGAAFTAPATVTVSANASDSDGTVARVDFYQGTTLIGSDTTSPYGITWSTVAAGSYSLTARATDDDGATTTSAAVSITVTSPATQRNAVFSASPDHDSVVNSYLLEIFSAGANPATAMPIATQNVGKPAVVNGEVTLDVTSTINGLSSGNYQATVSAVGSGGSSRSGAATFTR